MARFWHAPRSCDSTKNLVVRTLCAGSGRVVICTDTSDTAPIHGTDHAQHLLGGCASVEELQRQVASLDALGSAAYWIHQRQDLVNAVVNHRAPRSLFNHSGVDISCEPTNGSNWAKRATCLHSETAQFRFGVEPRSVKEYDRISHLLEQWDFHKPEEFVPVCCEDPQTSDAEPFPAVCFLTDYAGGFQCLATTTCAANDARRAPVMAVVYHHFSMLLLTIHDPSVPKLGPRYLDSQFRVEASLFCTSLDQAHLRSMQASIAHYTRLLCGIAFSNPVPSARIISCLAVSQCMCSVAMTVGSKAD